jgi:hypothetical protein
MKRVPRLRVAAWIVPVAAAIGLFGASSAAAATNPATKTFSFIAKPKSKTTTVLNINGILINARCNGAGEPVVFAFSSSTAADLFGRVFDGSGHLHVIHDSSFTKAGKGDRVSPTSNDFDATGALLYETSSGQVVTVQLAFDNATTLAKKNVCTVYGSAVAS